MKLLLAALATTMLAGSSLPAQARLGETLGQSQARYGLPREDLLGPQDKPLLAGSVEKQYLFEGFRVRAAFVEGRCLVVEYAHIPENSVPKQFTDAEVKAILAAESGLDEAKLANLPKDKQQEQQYRRWREEKIKDKGAVGDIAKGFKDALKLNKWTRADGAIAEYALGLVVKVSDRNADDWAKKFAREAAKKPPGTPGAPTPAGPKPVVPKF
jgi:hypothetical protein